MTLLNPPLSGSRQIHGCGHTSACHPSKRVWLASRQLRLYRHTVVGQSDQTGPLPSYPERTDAIRRSQFATDEDVLPSLEPLLSQDAVQAGHELQPGVQQAVHELRLPDEQQAVYEQRLPDEQRSAS
jgi:hypothetical protein